MINKNAIKGESEGDCQVLVRVATLRGLITRSGCPLRWVGGKCHLRGHRNYNQIDHAAPPLIGN